MYYILNILCILILCVSCTAYANIRFLTISDIHFGSHNQLKDNTDTGEEFLEITLKRFKQLTQDVDFILNLGDLPTHSLFVHSNKAMYEQRVFQGLYDANVHKKPMFYIPGNNDPLTGNYQPFESKGKSPLTYARNWTGACVHCSGLIIDKSSVTQGGYYSSYVIPHNKELILIALNTVQWAVIPGFRPPYPHQQRDALAQLSWLEKQLKNNHARQLLIAMHIPPGKNYLGKSFWHEVYLQKFIGLLKKYHHAYGEIILLSSHTHMDEIRKISLGKSSVFVFSTPSISRIHHNNPGMKIFILDKHMKLKNAITDYSTLLNKWTGDQYKALGSAESIFPDCPKALGLTQCLEGLSDKQVCDHLEQRLFYGVKSNRVHQDVCKITYGVYVCSRYCP